MESAVSEGEKFRSFRIFPNALDIVVMAVWVFVSQVIVTLAVIGCGFIFDGFDLMSVFEGSPDTGDIFASGEMNRTQAFYMFIIYVPAMLLSIGGIFLYRHLRGGRGRAVSFLAAGLNPTLLLWGVVWMLATEVVAEPLFGYLPDVPDFAGRGLWAVIATVICAPLLEEILCRGLILESVRKKYGVIMAWVVSTLFFAVIHGQITAMVNAFIIGSILGYICIRSKSVLSSIFLHGVNNALAITLLHFNMADVTLSSLIPDRRIYTVVYLSAAALCTIGAVSLVFGFRKECRDEKAAKTEAEA